MKDPTETTDQIAPPGQPPSGRITNASRHRPSTTSLLIANAIPLIGVVAFGWSTFAIVAVYWAENVVIGIINIFKIIFANPDRSQSNLPFVPKTGEQSEQMRDRDRHPSLVHRMKLLLVPCFIFHYGLFCTVRVCS